MPDPARRDDREQFEAWVDARLNTFDGDGEQMTRTQYLIAWDAWKAARQNTVGVEEVRELVEEIAAAHSPTEPSPPPVVWGRIVNLAAKLTHPQPAQTPAPEDHDG